METNVILQYRRQSEAWLCPDCDTENSVSLCTCAVCGGRQITGMPLKAWNEADESSPMIPNKEPSYETEDYNPSEKSAGTFLLWGFIIFFVFCILVYVLGNV